MKFKQRPIASAVALALAGTALQALAQQTPRPAVTETVTVTGIRASVEKSLETKRNADSVVEVITAEDIGKMPDKNIADSLQRVPGVTISSQAGGSGGFDENDRVSLRGTNPSLTQTLINGHAVATGDWFVLDQVGTVGRSMSFSLLPSELVSQVIVRKSATADLVEGGVAGAVDIITRTPLQFRKQVTAEGSLGAVYADLPKKTDPQLSGLVAWKNDAGTAGVMLQAFSEKRHLRRDGQEFLSWGQVGATSALARAVPALANVWYPGLIGSAFFEQERERKGGLLDIEVKPMNELSLDFSAFRSRMKATNYNRNWMFWGSRVIGGDNRVPSAYTISGSPGGVQTLTSATWPNVAGAQYAIVDEIYRPGAFSETNFFNFDARWRPSDRLSVTGQIGSTRGKGETPHESVFEGDVLNTGASYTLHGLGSGADVAFPNGNPSIFTGTTLDWIFGSAPARSEDKEKYAKVDAEWAFDHAMFTNLKFGARTAEHTRDITRVAQGPKFCGDFLCGNLNLPAWNGETYPGNFGNRLGGNFPRTPWMLDPGVLDAWAALYANRDPLAREFWPGEFGIKEKVNAVYAMVNFEGRGWAGNAGVRFVKTKEEVIENLGIPGSVCAPQAPCSVPGAITTSAFGSFFKSTISHDYNDVLPSANLKIDLAPNLVGRLAVARTMARPDYSALGGAISADDTTLTGNGGNPDLKPIRSNNFDATLEWYFAPRALASVGVFYMDLKNYVGFGVHEIQLLNIRDNVFRTYRISSPINSSGEVKGIELAGQMPLWGNFGVQGNYTYADAKEKDRPGCNVAAPPDFCGTASNPASTDLIGASKHTYNLSAYYEDRHFGARVAYTYRSHYLVGLDRSTQQHQDDTGTLAASFSYYLRDNITLQFDALNLNNPILKSYAINKDQPTAFYQNGRQFYFGVRIKI